MAVAEGSLAAEDGTGGKGGAAEYTRDGSVDLRGNPVLRSKRGGWTACSFIVGNASISHASLFLCID
jgi:hypothetical protein